MFSLNDENSLTYVVQLIQNILRVKDVNEGEFPIVLIGNKCDLEPTIKRSEIEKVIKENKVVYFETSVKNDINVDEALYDLSKQVLVWVNPYKPQPPEKKNNCLQM
jgi:GTPase KRas